MENEAEVIVVGAGPTGLLLAGDLARAGVKVTVLERRRNESNLTRAFTVHARTLELLDARGVADDLIKTGNVISVMQLFGELDLDLSQLPTRYPYLLSTPQYHTERILEARARDLGVSFVAGAEVVGLTQDDRGVTVDARTNDQGEEWRAAYVVGADGVRSAVREALDVPYPGHSAVQSVMLADVRFEEVPERDLVLKTVREGLSFIASFGDGWYRIIAWTDDDKRLKTLQSVSTRCAISPNSRSAPITASTTRAGSRGFTATNARCPIIGLAECSSRAMQHTATRPQVVRG